MKKILPLLFGIMILLSLGVVSAWWDTDWGRAKLITISSSETAENVSVLINVSYESYMQNDFDDIRFINETNDGTLGYWKYNNTCNDGVSCQFWVYIDEITAGVDKKIFMYYNNSGVSSTSSISNAFVYGEDTNRNVALGGHTWTMLGTSYSNFIGESRIKISTTGNNIQWYFTVDSQSSPPDGTTEQLAGITSAPNFRAELSSSASDTGTPAADTWYRGEFGINGTGNSYAKMLNDDRSTTYVTKTGTPSTGNLYPGWKGYRDTIPSGTGSSDWMYLRGYVENEPSYTFQDIGLISPADNSFSQTTSVEFNATIAAGLGTTITNASLYNDVGGWSLKSTNVLSGTLNNTNFTDTISGTTIWNVQACFSDNTCSFSGSNFTVNLDTTAPTIDVTFPNETINYHKSGEALDLNWTASDTNLEQCWFEYDNVNTTVTCADNYTTFVVSDSSINSLKFWANDSATNLASDTVTWNYLTFENNRTFNATTVETATEGFILNLSLDSSLVSTSAVLVYDDARYSSSSTIAGIFTRSIDIPLLEGSEVGGNKTFYWEISAFDGTTTSVFNTSFGNQTLSLLQLGECNATLTTKTLNFTAYEESNLTRVTPFQFDGTFDIWAGDGSTKKSVSITNSSAHSVELCMSASTPIKIDGALSYDGAIANTTYSPRTYRFIEETLTTTIQEINLLLIRASDVTEFVQYVKSIEQSVANAIIKTFRYYPGLGEYKITQVTKTGPDGQTIGFYQTGQIDYRHEIYVGGDLVLNETNGYNVIADTVPFTITFQIGSPPLYPGLPFNEVDGATFTLFYNETSELVTFTFLQDSDPETPDVFGGRLFVEQRKFARNNVEICNTSTNSSSATITCNMTGLEGRFNIEGFITITGEDEALVGRISLNLSQSDEIFGFGGVLLAWFIILISSMMFLGNEVVGAISVALSTIFVNIIGLINMSWLVIVGIVATSIVVAVVLSKNES